MQKKDIIDLIKYHVEDNDHAFRDKAYAVARFFDENNDEQLASYIMALLSGANAFTPQSLNHQLDFFEKVKLEPNRTTLLPERISEDILGVISAINKKAGIHRILFEGGPGTGKTETVYNIATIMEKELYKVKISSLVDSRLGQTAKNIVAMFDELKALPRPDKMFVFFDEIDAIALDRVNGNDLREMGRVTSTMLNELEEVNEDIVIFATTNLYNKLDRALSRRFDVVVNFDRYSKEDLAEIGNVFLGQFASRFGNVEKDTRFFKKILMTAKALPSPGELKNIIRTSLAFSKDGDPYDYLRKLYTKLNGELRNTDMAKLRTQGFTVREIGVLMESSKTYIAKELSEERPA